MNKVRNKLLIPFAFLIVCSLILSACGGGASQSASSAAAPSQQTGGTASATENESAAAPEALDLKAYAGTELVFAILDTANWRKNDNLVAPLAEATGMALMFDYIPENAYMTKLQVALASGTGEYDAMYANNKMYPELFASGWIEPLDDYLNNPAKSMPDYEFEDFIPKVAQSFQYQGKQLGIPMASESNILFYNKNMFAAAGLTEPPKTMEEVREYAEILNDPDNGVAGIAMLGTREGNVNGYGWIMQWLAMGGSWTPEGQEPYTVLANKEAIEATTLWAEMLTKYGPPGISNFGWNELYLTMQQEQTAMCIATTKDYPLFVDPEKSKLGDHLGFACIEGPGEAYTVGNISGWLIPTSSKNKDAAFLGVQFLTCKESAERQVREMNVVDAPRQSIMYSVLSEMYDPEWAAATAQALNHGVVEYTPLIPQGGQIREFLAVALSKCLSGQATPEVAMKEANDATISLLEETAS